MAEELSYDNINDVITIDLPVSLNKRKNGQFVLDRWMFQDEMEIEDGITTEPISLLVDNIIARSKAPINLKETYIRYNFFDKLSNTLDSEEFESLVEELSSTNLDKKDTTSDPLLDMYNKRIQYPYWN
jgi:D-lyxose ketol-isomerase